MSLDVYLEGPEFETACRCAECGHEHKRKTREEFYQSNITHNLNAMADAAGIYQYLWRPDEIGITMASELIEPLTAGLKELEARPEHFAQFNATNGWGLYKHFVPFVRQYLAACREHPNAFVHVSR
jgi:hypothetical protein